MITSLIIDGILKLVQIRKDSNKKTHVARIYDPRGTMPEAVLTELKDKQNVFHDDVNNKDYRLTPLGMVCI